MKDELRRKVENSMAYGKRIGEMTRDELMLAVYRLGVFSQRILEERISLGECVSGPAATIAGIVFARHNSESRQTF